MNCKRLFYYGYRIGEMSGCENPLCSKSQFNVILVIFETVKSATFEPICLVLPHLMHQLIKECRHQNKNAFRYNLI